MWAFRYGSICILSVPDENPGGAGITPNSTSTEPTRKCVAVQINTLENLLSEEDRNQITFAKVDIEGHEPRVWDSLMRCPGLKRMIVELGRYHGSQFLNKISQEFHLFDIRSGEMKELLVEDILAIPHFLNVLCIRKATA